MHSLRPFSFLLLSSLIFLFVTNEEILAQTGKISPTGEVQHIWTLNRETTPQHERPGGTLRAAPQDTIDPLGGARAFRKSMELISIGKDINTGAVRTQVFDTRHLEGLGDTLMQGPPFEWSTTSWRAGNHHYGEAAIVAGDFDGNGRDEVASVWDDDSIKGSFTIGTARIDPFSLAWYDTQTVRSDSNILLQHNAGLQTDTRTLLARKGNFDSDTRDELILCYQSIDSSIKITLYDLDTNLTLTLCASATDPVLNLPHHEGGWFWGRYPDIDYRLVDIAVDDYDHDGVDEILLGRAQMTSGLDWELTLCVYDYDPASHIFTRHPASTILTRAGVIKGQYPLKVLLSPAHFTDRSKHDCLLQVSILDTSYLSGWSIERHYNTLFPITVSSDLDHIAATDTLWDLRPVRCFYPAVSTAGDVNKDNRDEIVYVPGDQQVMEVYSLDTSMHMTPKLSRPVFYCVAGDFIFVNDVDTDTSDAAWTPEVLYDQEGYYIFEPTLDSTGTLKSLDERIGIYNRFRYIYTTVPGDIDGDDVRMGTPRHFRKSDIQQPIVILNAPPIHFDQFDGVCYDVSKAYNENQCDFFARYEKISSTSTEVQTQMNRDWGVSASMSGGFSFWGIGVKTEMTAQYGESFSKDEASSQTITIGVGADAIVDDRIYATVSDYDVWEYPVYVSNELKGNILVVRPSLTANTWFHSKSWTAANYVPNHEVGNILSYKEYPDLINNPNIGEKVKGTTTVGFDLDQNSSYDWSLAFSDFTSSGATTSWNAGVEVGTTVEGWGLEVSVNGHYNQEEISTHKTTVGSDLSLQLHLDGLDMSVGEAGYRVIPYAYWATNGALVVDYAVRPELAPPGFTPTWWQEQYDSIPDPAFILPWRLDPEKGLTLTDPTKRSQTKDITFHPKEPDAGDTVTIVARVHNFSLVPTGGPVKIKFYVGDPDAGGSLIIGLNGDSSASTAGSILSRDDATVRMQWIIPSDLGQYPRIYAALDPGSEISEIHEDNNKGWTVLGKQTVVGVEESPARTIPSKFTLAQNYPNPFNPTTTISFDLPSAYDVKMVVYDVLGREITTLLDQFVQAGTHKLKFDATGMPSGVYFYRIHTKNFTATKKLILLK